MMFVNEYPERFAGDIEVIFNTDSSTTVEWRDCYKRVVYTGTFYRIDGSSISADNIAEGVLRISGFTNTDARMAGYTNTLMKGAEECIRTHFDDGNWPFSKIDMDEYIQVFCRGEWSEGDCTTQAEINAEMDGELDKFLKKFKLQKQIRKK